MSELVAGYWSLLTSASLPALIVCVQDLCFNSGISNYKSNTSLIKIELNNRHKSAAQLPTHKTCASVSDI